MSSPSLETRPVLGPGAWRTTSSLGISHGQAAQKDLVHQAEDGGVGADAEREGDDGDDGEAEIFPRTRRPKRMSCQQGVVHRGRELLVSMSAYTSRIGVGSARHAQGMLAGAAVADAQRV